MDFIAILMRFISDWISLYNRKKQINTYRYIYMDYISVIINKHKTEITLNFAILAICSLNQDYMVT